MNFDRERHQKVYAGEENCLQTPVLMIFFNRPKQFFKVFEQVKKAKPYKLFLYQDGPRAGKQDETGIRECREVLRLIDWNCEVYTWFREENCGCDPSEYLAQKWAFGLVDKCIVLEDDDVPSQSFFYFCQELLNKYEYDDRINMISGANTLEQYHNAEADYFFSTICSIWGWASWSRVVNEWDSEYAFLTNQHAVDNMIALRKSTQTAQLLKSARNHKAAGKAYYETILAAQMFLSHRINIVPSKNLISNIGIAATSTHSTDSVEKLPHGIRRVFNMKTYELDFPLRHPKYIMEDIEYQKRVKRVLGWDHPFVRFWRRIDSKISKLLFALKHKK